MAKLKLVWEDTPDTPLTASNLSKILKEYENNNMLFIDTNDLVTNADYKLKLRANSRIAINTKKTSAYFKFNNSLMSHDSKVSATVAENINFRYETPRSIGKSLSLETGTINKILNSDFSDGLNNWETINSFGLGVVSLDTDGLYGDNCAHLSVNDQNSKASLSQGIILPPVASSGENPYLSISFYYKSDGELNFLITGRYITTNPVYLNASEDELKWEINSSAAIISLAPTNTWKRFEIKNIRTDTLWSANNSSNNLKIEIYSTQYNSHSCIDAVQIEEKKFCSTFTPSTRSESVVKYNSDIMRIDKGMIDLEFMPKYFNQEKNTIFKIKMQPQTDPHFEIFTDAMKLELNIPESSIVFSIYDFTTQSEIKTSKLLSSSAFNKLIDNWQRIIISWDQYDPYIKLSLNGDMPSLSSSVFTTNPLLLTDIELGGSSLDKMEGLLSSLKFNVFPKTTDDMIIDLLAAPAPDENIYKIFESTNEDTFIDAHLLDTGYSLEPSKEYYVYLCDEEGITEELDLIVSTNAISPIGKNKFFSHIIGGFRTDSSSLPIISSLWDIKTKSMLTTMVERFIVHGENSISNDVEIRTIPYGDANDAKFNIPTYVTDHFYGVSGGSNFLDIDPAGFLKVDDIKINTNTIETLGSDLILKSPTNKNAQINASNININAEIDVNITPGTNVDINSGTGDIQLDNVRIKGTQIRALLNNDLTISNDATNATSEIKINGYTGKSRILGSKHINDAIDTEINGSIVTIKPSTTTQINSGANPVYIDNISFKEDTISSKTGGDLHLTSPTQIQIDNNVLVNSGKQIVFNSVAGQRINFDGATGNSGIGMQDGSSTYFKTNAHFAWYKQGTPGAAFGSMAGGTVLGLILSGTATASSLNITVEPTAKFYAGRVYNAVWNDIAECWNKDSNYKFEYGQVVVQTEKGLRPSNKRSEKASMGVISNTYGYLLGEDGFDVDLNISKKLPIGIAGRVKVKIHGSVSIGDEIVSYKQGKAIRASWFEKIFKRDRIIGMIDSLESNGYYQIKIK